MAYAKVRMLVFTAYKVPRKPGDIIKVPEDFAKRWVKNGLAEYVDDADAPTDESAEIKKAVDELVEGPTEEPVQEVPDEDKDVSGINFDDMSVKELYTYCTEHGIEVEQRKKRPYYMAALKEAGIIEEDE